MPKDSNAGSFPLDRSNGGTVSDGLIPFGSFLSYFFGHSRRQSGSEAESFAGTSFGRPKDLAYIKDEAWAE
jgi:hypothetical protein